MNVMMAANENATWIAGQLPMMADAKDPGWTANCPQIIAVSSTCTNVDAAMVFADYLFNNPDSMSTLACTRSVPATEKAREICKEDGTLDPVMMEAANICSSYGGLTPDRYASSQEARRSLQMQLRLQLWSKHSADAAAEVIPQLEALIQ